MRSSLLALALLIPLTQCSSSTPAATTPTGTAAAFDLHATLSSPDHYWDFPYPSDLRLTADGAPDVSGFPNSLGAAIITGFQTTTAKRKGFPVIPVAYFKLTAPIATRHYADVLPADAGQPILLIDVDPTSPERGKLIPVVAETPQTDRYVPDNMLAVTARQGMLLHPKRTYAFVVMKSLKDAAGAPLATPAALTALEKSTPPAADPELKAYNVYQPLWQTLTTLKIDAAQVAVATVFTTGDVVQDTFDQSSKAIAKYSAAISGLAVRKDGNQTRNCELTGTISYPQFQKGTPPFDKDGDFEFDADGTLKKQRDEIAPISLSFPQTLMPQAGYPLVVYVHGSGGLSVQALDRGKITQAFPNGTPHEGPAFVLAAHGFAVAGSAMPVNPERLPGASDLAYINFNNLAAFPYTFRQGVIEQRLFIDALSKLTIDPSVVASCPGVTLPMGSTAVKLDLTRLAIQGQSMGGQYVNMTAAVEPRIGAAAPSGGGGLWSDVVLTNKVIPNSSGNVGLLMGTTAPLTFMHPALHLLETAWEPADALVYTRRLSRMPLAGHPSRDVYEPAGKDDEYFATGIYDAMALGYGHKQAGTEVWPTMQPALTLDGRGGILPYPIAQDLTAEDGKSKYTGVVVQYAGDGFADPHYIFQQLDEVKYQYGCFFETYLKKGRATVPAPAALGTPCPGL